LPFFSGVAGGQDSSATGDPTEGSAETETRACVYQRPEEDRSEIDAPPDCNLQLIDPARRNTYYSPYGIEGWHQSGELFVDNGRLTTVEPAAVAPSVVAQYDATQEGSTGSITAITDRVGSFDLSGTAEVISSGINSKQTYRFDGSESMIQGSFMADTEPIVIMAVAEQQEAVFSNGFYFDSDADLGFGLQDDGGDEYNLYRGGGGGGSSFGSVTQSPQLIELHGINSDELELFQGGTSQGSQVANSADLTGLTLADRGGGGNAIEIDYGEVTVLEAPTAQEIQNERDRLKQKWGL
jgi:hypothetical protein